MNCGVLEILPGHFKIKVKASLYKFQEVRFSLIVFCLKCEIVFTPKSLSCMIKASISYVYGENEQSIPS